MGTQTKKKNSRKGILVFLVKRLNACWADAKVFFLIGIGFTIKKNFRRTLHRLFGGKPRRFCDQLNFSKERKGRDWPKDHLHNYGPGTRFGASPTRIGCDECVSHLSVRSSSALECRSEITVVFLAVPIELGLVVRSSLVVFRGQVSSGSAGYLPFVRLTDRTTAPPTARSYALSKSFLRKSVAFMLVPKSLWTLPSPVL